MVLPVQGETTQGKHAQAQTGQGAIGGLVQPSQQGGAASGLPAGQRTLDQGEWTGAGRPGHAPTHNAKGFPGGDAAGQVRGDQELRSESRKSTTQAAYQQGVWARLTAGPDSPA
jgi:hypothetical protein